MVIAVDFNSGFSHLPNCVCFVETTVEDSWETDKIVINKSSIFYLPDSLIFLRACFVTPHMFPFESECVFFVFCAYTHY